MGIPDLRQLSEPIGPYRDWYEVDIGSVDFELASGFTCEIVAAPAQNELIYRTLEGGADQTRANLAVGDVIVGPGKNPGILRVIRGSSTVTRVLLGIL